MAFLILGYAALPICVAPWRLATLTAICGLALLAGCGGGGIGVNYIVGPEYLVQQQLSGCGLERLAGLQGQHFTGLADYQLAGELRVLNPGQGVTRDLMPDRLNAQIDNAGKIRRMFCG